MSAPFSEDQYKTDTMNPIKAQAVPSAPPAVKGSYRSVSQGYDNVPDIEVGVGDAVDAHVQCQMRLGFIRKVYGILTCQLALTTIVCSVLALNGACRRFVMTTPSQPVWKSYFGRPITRCCPRGRVGSRWRVGSRRSTQRNSLVDFHTGR